MRRGGCVRTAAPLVLLALLVLLSGCAAFGSGEVDEERLAEEAEYDWSGSADVRVTLGGNQYRAVYRVENRSEIEVFRFRRLNERRAVTVSALQFRYPNGTVVGHEAMAVERTRAQTVITLPASEGQVAFTAPNAGKRLRLPVTVEGGSYEVVLPPGGRVQYFLFGRVRPPGYETSRPDDRVHIRWDAVESDRIVVRYYLQRDLYLFAGLFVAAGSVAVGGLAFFFLQLRSLRARREAVGLDVGGDDDGDRRRFP